MSIDTKLTLKNVRLGGCSIFEPRAYMEGQTPNYSAIFLLKPKDPQIKKIHNKIVELARDKWGKNVPKTLKTCLVSGDEKDNEAYHGHMTISASERQQPHIIGKLKEPLTAEDGKPYSGCYVNCVLTLWAQDNKYGRRINANLRGIQFAAEGEPIGRIPIDPDKEFDDLSEDDEIPFEMEKEEAEVPLY